MKVIVSPTMKSESISKPQLAIPSRKPVPKPIDSAKRKDKILALTEELAKVDAQLGKPATLKKHDLLKAQIAKLKARPAAMPARRVSGMGGGLPGRISGTLAQFKQKQRTRSLKAR